MTDRTVAVTLRMMAQDYIRNAKAAQSQTEALAKSQDTAARKVQAQRQSMTNVSAGFAIAGAAMATAIGLAVKSAADFEKQLSQVRAVSGATAGEMDKLRSAALKAGADTVFSASQAAEAETELAKVGVSTSDILGGALTGSLNLAAAGSLSLADAATYAGQTMKIFNLGGKDVSHIADVLASGANKSAADVSTLAQALQQSGLQAAQTGLSLEDTVGTLSLFADNALNGSDAGTSFKTMLARLVPQTTQQAAAMKQLGLDFYDAKGNFIGIADSAEMLRQKLGGLSVEQRQAALQTIFGTDAIRAATVLYNAGAAGIEKYVAAVNDQGAAARVAAINMDNLSGDLEQLRGSIETALIKGGSQGTGVLRDLVQAATGAVNAFANLPDSVQGVGIGLGAIVTAGLLAGGMFLSLVPKIAAARTALIELGVTSQAVKGLLGGPWGVALAAGTLALGLFAKSQLDARNAADALLASLDQQTGAITDQTRAIVASNLQQSGALTTAQKYGLSLKDINDAALGMPDALARVKSQMDAVTTATTAQTQSIVGLSSASTDASKAFKFTGDAQAQLSTVAQQFTQDAVTPQRVEFSALMDTIGQTASVLGDQTDAQKQIAEATGDTTDATKGLTSATQTQTQAAQQAADAAQSVADSYDKARKAFIDYGNTVSGAINAEVAYRQSVADANAQLLDQKGNLDKAKLGLDANTQAGRDNLKALTDIAEKGKENAAAAYDQTQKVDTLNQAIASSRAAFIAVAEKMGASKAKANELATQLGLTADNVNNLTTDLNLVPKQVQSKVTADTAPANAAVDGARRKLDLMDGYTVTAKIAVQADQAFATTRALAAALQAIHDKTVTITTNTYTGLYANKPAVEADGGYIAGPGTATSDSIPARLSNGEYVVKAAAVARYGRTFFDTVNAMRFASGGMVGTATGAGATSVNITGAHITGTLDTPFGPAQIRGVVQQAITDQARSVRAGYR